MMAETGICSTLTKMIRIKSVVFLLTFFSACTVHAESNALSFPNSYQMTADKAKELGLPPVDFSLSYQDGIETIEPAVGKLNESYIELLSRGSDGKLREVLTLRYAVNAGWLQASGTLGEFGRLLFDRLFEQFATNLRDSFPNAESIEIVESTWRGIKGKQLRARLHVTDPDQNLDDDVLMLIVVAPPPRETQNGVLVIMQAIEGSEIVTFSDFGTTGMPIEVLRTFEFE